MRRVHILLSLVIVLLAGACGNSSATLPDYSAASPEGGVERLLAAAADADVTSLRMSLAAEFGGLAEFGGETVSFGLEAAFSADGDQGEMSFDFGELMEAAAAQDPGALGADMAGVFGDSIEMRFIDDTVYMSSFAGGRAGSTSGRRGWRSPTTVRPPSGPASTWRRSPPRSSSPSSAQSTVMPPSSAPR